MFAFVDFRTNKPVSPKFQSLRSKVCVFVTNRFSCFLFRANVMWITKKSYLEFWNDAWILEVCFFFTIDIHSIFKIMNIGKSQWLNHPKSTSQMLSNATSPGMDKTLYIYFVSSFSALDTLTVPQSLSNVKVITHSTL